MPKISQYERLLTPSLDDLLVIVDVNDMTMASSGTTKAITVTEVLSLTGNPDGGSAIGGQYPVTAIDGGDA